MNYFTDMLLGKLPPAPPPPQAKPKEKPKAKERKPKKPTPTARLAFKLLGTRWFTAAEYSEIMEVRADSARSTLHVWEKQYGILEARDSGLRTCKNALILQRRFIADKFSAS